MYANNLYPLHHYKKERLITVAVCVSFPIDFFASLASIEVKNVVIAVST